MVDLTTDEQDNSNFITSVELNDDFNTYTITYADGHTDVKVFDSVHNFNVDLYKMQNQYYQYHDSFSKEMSKWLVDTIKKSLVGLALTIIGIVMEVKFVPSGFIKTLLIILTILFSLGYELLKYRDLVTIGYSTSYLDNLRRFISIQEGLKVPVKDPKTGKDDEWYLANLSTINLGTDVSLYEKYAVTMHDPALKEEEGRRLTKVLKGE